MKKLFSSTVFTMMIIVTVTASAQVSNSSDLIQLYKDNKLTVFNRDISTGTDNSKNSLTMSLQEGEGLVWLNGVSFSTGTIEVDLKGQDLFQHSFLGIAFHGKDEETFEAIYFRPFRFRSSDAVDKSHSVQYISLPEYTWQKLREDKNGVYENVLGAEVDPDNWFHAKIVITENEVLVYLNDATTPCLKAPLLSKNKTGKIALYAADQSGGTFANLIVKKD